MTSISRALAGALALSLAAACSAPAPAQKSAAQPMTLPGGTSFDVTLTAPADGALVASPPGDVGVAGTFSLGDGAPQPDTALVYVLDASTAAGGAVACGTATTLLACQKQAVAAMNARAVALGIVGDVGAALFAATGAPLDVDPATGAQLVAAPGADGDGNATADVLDAVGSIAAGGTATLFTSASVGGATAAVGNGLLAGITVAGASARPSRIIVLLSASPTVGGPAPADVTVPAGIVVRAFALPGTTCAAGLAAYAERGASGSGCEDVADASALAGRLEALLDAELVAAELVVDGGAPAPLALSLTLPAQAPVTGTFAATLAGLAPGAHEICARLSGRDAGGTGTAQDCATVKVATIDLAPPAQTFELGTPGQTATVTATVAAGTAGGVAGATVAFEITTGPNAGRSATATTDAEGKALFTWEAIQHLAGLGTDVVSACFEDAEGHEACAAATVTWQDTTPPVVACIPGPNPGGKVVTHGGGGLSPSGFMRLTAVDAVDPAPLVFLQDTGSGMVLGPFASGVAVKYTQAPGGKARVTEMGSDENGGTEILHVTGRGDPAVVGRDAMDNESDPLVCPVPPLGK
jgi:hypothetical protein